MRSLFYPVLFLIVMVVFGVAWLVFQPGWMPDIPAAIAGFVQMIRMAMSAFNEQR